MPRERVEPALPHLDRIVAGEQNQIHAGEQVQEDTVGRGRQPRGAQRRRVSLVEDALCRRHCGTLPCHGRRASRLRDARGEVVTLLDALTAAGIRFILARHETAAAIMAAGAAAASGAPGLLVTTLGPGLANAVNGIADAAQERAPLLVVSGVVERGIRARYTHQILDHAALLRPLVKASVEIEPEGAAAVVARAIALATTPPCGPVHLDLSPTVAATLDPSPTSLNVAAPTSLPAVDPTDPAIADIRRLLSISRRPVFIAGFTGHACSLGCQ